MHPRTTLTVFTFVKQWSPASTVSSKFKSRLLVNNLNIRVFPDAVTCYFKQGMSSFEQIHAKGWCHHHLGQEPSSTMRYITSCSAGCLRVNWHKISYKWEMLRVHHLPASPSGSYQCNKGLQETSSVSKQDWLRSVGSCYLGLTLHSLMKLALII